MSSTPTRPRENLFLNLICNLALPTLILMKFSSERWLGPHLGLLVALAFPLGYGVWDFVQRRKANLFSVIGLASVLLSGGLGLLKLGGIWFAAKEAAIPFVIGVAVLLSTRSKRPLIRTVLMNEEIMDVARVETALEARQSRPAFAQLLTRASFGLAGSFFLSAALNFALARYVLRSAPDTASFNAELAEMQWLSLLVIALPSMICLMLVLWWLVKGIERLTGLGFDDIFHGEKKAEPAGTAPGTEKPDGT